MQRCASLRAPAHAPAARCARGAAASTSTWEATSGRGRIWSFVVPHPPLLAAYAELAPYNVVVVELDEDPTIRFTGNVVDTPDGALDQVDPPHLDIGEAVEVCFAPAVDGIALPRWRRPA